MTRFAPTPRHVNPNPAVDAYEAERFQSLFNGNARYKADQSSPAYHRDIARSHHFTETPRKKVTLADRVQPSYLD